MITAAVVTVVGSISYIGLIVPNLVSLFKGDDLRGTLPDTALVGALFVLLFDLAARTIVAPFELPIELIVWIVGSAVFIALILHRLRCGRRRLRLDDGSSRRCPQAPHRDDAPRGLRRHGLPSLPVRIRQPEVLRLRDVAAPAAPCGHRHGGRRRCGRLARLPQTVIRNNIVTPCLLGMNSLYVLIHTVVAFVFGATSAVATDPVAQFAVDLALMGVMGLLIYGVLFEKTGGNVLYILLIGTVLTTFFSSIQASLVRMMDPNEYDALMNSLTASFTNVSASLIPAALVILTMLAFALRRDLAVLNILALGRDAATSLGVDYDRTTRRLLVGVALSIAVATALVGPISFLGLITANLSRRLFMTYRHGTLIAGSVLIGIVVLAGGQFAVEHLAAFSVPVSVFITIMGGVYFLYLILRGKGL